VLVILFAVGWPILSFEGVLLTAGGVSKNVAEALSQPGLRAVLSNTVELALASTALALIIGICLAWCALRVPRRFEAIAMILPMMPLLVPVIATISGWIFLFSPAVGYGNSALRLLPPFHNLSEGPINIYTVPGIVFVSAMSLASFAYTFALNGLRSTGQEYEDAATVSGASRPRVFFTVTLPQMLPSLIFGTGITLMLSLGQFAAPLLIGSNVDFSVLTTRMFSLLAAYPIPFGVIATLGLPLLGAGLAVLVLQRMAIGDQRRYAVVGGRATFVPRKRFLWTAVVIFLYGIVAVLLPVLALVYVGASRYWSGSLSLQGLSASHFLNVITENYGIQSAIATSVIASACAILITVPVGYVAALVLSNRLPAPRWAVVLLDALVTLPYGIPGVLVGFAMLFAYTKPPLVLYGTAAIIVVAYSTIMLPYATRLQLASLLALGPEPWEASRVSGAGLLRTFVLVTIPMMRKGAAAAAALIFLLLFQEFSVSVLVRAPGVQVAGTVLYDQYNFGSYPEVAVVSLVMVCFAIVGLALLFIIGGKDALNGMGGGGRA
jgi:iron(III) transport system permease protein